MGPATARDNAREAELRRGRTPRAGERVQVPGGAVGTIVGQRGGVVMVAGLDGDFTRRKPFKATELKRYMRDRWEHARPIRVEPHVLEYASVQGGRTVRVLRKGIRWAWVEESPTQPKLERVLIEDLWRLPDVAQ